MRLHEESILHHEQKAEWHRQQGHPQEWVDRSLRKAARWRQRSREFDIATSGPMPRTAIDALTRDHMERVSKRMMRDFAKVMLG